MPVNNSPSTANRYRIFPFLPANSSNDSVRNAMVETAIAELLASDCLGGRELKGRHLTLPSEKVWDSLRENVARFRTSNGVSLILEKAKS